jgi:hypothetical protein
MTRATIALIAAALLVHAVAVHAAPLEKDECAKLKGEQTQLEQGGVRGSMGRGPEWAKANLAPDKLEQIRRIIEIDEQLLFRCQGRPLVNLREPQDPDPAAQGPNGKTAPKPPAAAKAEKKTPVKKAIAQPPAGAAKPASQSPVAAPAVAKKAPAAKQGDEAAKAKAKPKRKNSEANSGSDWVTNPFTNLLAPSDKK